MALRSSPHHVPQLVAWIAQSVRNAQAQGVVVGISGGIDSAVCAALAKQALGDNVLGLILPCHTLAEDLQDARTVCRHFQVAHEEIDLSEIFDHLARLVGSSNPKLLGNLKARLRMAVLYHRAAELGYLVMGTSNRSEWEVGYFTKYGDGAADMQPIVHLLKKDVQRLARVLKVPKPILTKPPSAGLWPGQTDEEELGFSYKQLDRFLSGRERSVPPPVRRRIEELQAQTAHKRRPPLRFAQETLEPYPKQELVALETSPADRSVESLTVISKAIASDRFLEDILRLIVMATAELMHASVCCLWLLDEEERVLRLRATQAINPEDVKDRVLKVGEGVVGKVVVDNKPYIALNVLEDPYFKEKELARRLGLVSMLSLPLRFRDRVIGVINGFTAEPHRFTPLEMNVLTAVADQAAVAIENTELMIKSKIIQEELEKRKVIEKAKDLLISRRNLSSEEAYRWLQKRSMDTRKSMREVAEAVLLTLEG